MTNPRTHNPWLAVLALTTALLSCNGADSEPTPDGGGTTPPVGPPAAAAAGPAQPAQSEATSQPAGARDADTQTYQNAAHGYAIELPADAEIEETNRGQYVKVAGHGTLFGIWLRPGTAAPATQNALLSSLNNWCGKHPDCAAARSEHGPLRLIEITQGDFEGFKAVAEKQPDDAPARFYVFRSRRQEGYFGFNLTPALTADVVASLQPL